MNRKRFVAVLASALLVVGVTTYVSNTLSTRADCVTVYVDYGVLDNGTKVVKCINVPQKTGALNVLQSAGFIVDGTKKYGSQVACRVNGLPSAIAPVNVSNHENYVETCTDMPAAFAYWAVLVKRLPDTANPLDQSKKWGWAATGIDKIFLSPGDSIGLVFADNDRVEFPN